MNRRKWRKLGQIFAADPPTSHPKLASHAANPLPVHMEGDTYRIFFSGRDENSRSSVGAVDIDINRREIIQRHDHPFFEYGPADSFYADGVSIGNCYRTVDGNRYMLFMGWQNHHGSHWRGDIGRLRVNNDLTLELDNDTPFLASDETDPISLSYPWVMPVIGGGYRMWYGSTISWDAGNGEMLHVINSACSNDGHHWERHGLAVPYELGVAQAFSRPTVIGDPNEGYHMWFSYRSGTRESYRIGYAFSDDGDTWELALKNAGIDVSASGWDTEMIEYPFVLDHDGARYLLYNGNGFGKSGFGLAVLD